MFREHPLDNYFRGLVALLSSQLGSAKVLSDLQAEQRRLDAESAPERTQRLLSGVRKGAIYV